MFDPKEAAKAQERYCEDNALPRFTPDDGNCPHCGRNIYAEDYSVEDAGKNLITYCRHCNYSFLE